MASNKEYTYVKVGTIPVGKLPPLNPTLKQIMKDELSLGIGLTIFYYLFILSIPIMNWYAPDIAMIKVWGGMTLSWFLTTFVTMALAFIIAYVNTILYKKRMSKYVATPITNSRTNEGAGYD